VATLPTIMSSSNTIAALCAQRLAAEAEVRRKRDRLLGIKVAATTAYHPQGDGQTERVNQELEQYLRPFISQRQDDWVDLLPLAEFQYNNYVHSATQHPLAPVCLEWGSNLISDHLKSNRLMSSPSVCEVP
jgi:hypothetical protein